MKTLIILALVIFSGCASTHKSMRITFERDLFDDSTTKVKAEFRVGNITFLANGNL